MFKVLEFNSETGEFTPVTNHAEFEEGRAELDARKSEHQTHILVYERDGNFEPDNENELIMKVIEANNGNVLRVIKGVSVAKLEGSVCCGAGSNCFCVVSGGSQYCAAYYCDIHGICSEVRCSIPCGC